MYHRLFSCLLMQAGSESALSQIRNSSSPITTATTSNYQALLAFVNGVRHSCSVVEDICDLHGSLNLTSFLEKICDKTWADMKATLFSYVTSSGHR